MRQAVSVRVDGFNTLALHVNPHHVHGDSTLLGVSVVRGMTWIDKRRLHQQ